MQKKILAALLTLCMLLSVAPLAVSAADAHTHSWDTDNKCSCGAKAITTAEELATLMGNSSAWGTESAPVHYVLVSDNNTFDMTGQTVSPIGTSTVPFYGTFDGNGCTISNYTLTGASGNGYVGFFGRVGSGSTIKNLTVGDGDGDKIEGSGTYVGGIVGYAANTFTIENCTNNCKVSGGSYTGGILASNNTSGTATITVKGCVNNGEVDGGSTATGKNFTGGIIGYGLLANSNATFTLENCINNGKVTGGSSGTYIYTGGIVGWAQLSKNNSLTGSSMLIKKCTNNAIVAGGQNDDAPTYTGGIAGNIRNDEPYCSITIEDCENTNAVSNSAYAAGIAGCVGSSSNTCKGAVQIKNCTNSGNVTVADQYAGGIASYTHGVKLSNGTNSVSISNCENTADVVATGAAAQDIGGIVGIAWFASVSNCTNEGDISGYKNVAGIVGRTQTMATIEYCKNTGDVTASGSQVGGIVGHLKSADSNVTVCWNDGTVTANVKDETVNANAGGIIGVYEGAGTVTYCYNSGKVKYYRQYTGGIIGQTKAEDGDSDNNGKTIDYCYSDGTIEQMTDVTVNVGDTNYVRSICGYPAAAVFTNCYYATAIDGDANTKGSYSPALYVCADHFTALNGETQTWIKTTTGPELKYFHDQTHGEGETSCEYCTCNHTAAFGAVYESISDTQHKCTNCDATSAHDFTGGTCVCGITKLTLTALDMVDGVLVPTFSPSIGDADIQLTVTNKTVEDSTLTVSGFSLTGEDAEDYLLDASESYAITLTAEDLTTVTVNYVCGETEVQASATETVVKGLEYSFTAPSVEGYTFSNWQDNSTNATYTATVSGNVTLTANYTEDSSAGEGGNEEEETVQQSDIRKSLVLVLGLISRNNRNCVVTYKSTGASTHVYETVKKGTVLQMPEAPTKEGYTFVGWYKDINGVKPFDFNTKITGNVSIYAKWVKN